MSYRGKIKLKKLSHPEKYMGKGEYVSYDSLWERKMIYSFDKDVSVISYCREPFGIPYYFEGDKKNHKYMIDFYVKIKDEVGNISEQLIEVKPYKQTMAPKVSLTAKTKKPTKGYYKRLWVWHKNQAKWLAAKALCEKNNWKFIILHENNTNFTKRKK